MLLLLFQYSKYIRGLFLQTRLVTSGESAAGRYEGRGFMFKTTPVFPMIANYVKLYHQQILTVSITSYDIVF